MASLKSVKVDFILISNFGKMATSLENLFGIVLCADDYIKAALPILGRERLAAMASNSNMRYSKRELYCILQSLGFDYNFRTSNLTYMREVIGGNREVLK